MARKLHEPVAVEVVPGTCLMVRREVFSQAGLFNPAYFMYAEDVELCCQARRLGWQTYYLHDAMVIHGGARSSQLQEDDAFAAILMRESVWKFLAASRGRLYAALYRVATGRPPLAGCWPVAGCGWPPEANEDHRGRRRRRSGFECCAGAWVGKNGQVAWACCGRKPYRQGKCAPRFRRGKAPALDQPVFSLRANRWIQFPRS